MVGGRWNGSNMSMDVTAEITGYDRPLSVFLVDKDGKTIKTNTSRFEMIVIRNGEGGLSPFSNRIHFTMKDFVAHIAVTEANDPTKVVKVFNVPKRLRLA